MALGLGAGGSATVTFFFSFAVCLGDGGTLASFYSFSIFAILILKVRSMILFLNSASCTFLLSRSCTYFFELAFIYLRRSLSMAFISLRFLASFLSCFYCSFLSFSYCFLSRIFLAALRLASLSNFSWSCYASVGPVSLGCCYTTTG